MLWFFKKIKWAYLTSTILGIIAYHAFCLPLKVAEELHEFLSLLNVMPEQLTNEYYTDMVKQARSL